MSEEELFDALLCARRAEEMLRKVFSMLITVDASVAARHVKIAQRTHREADRLVKALVKKIQRIEKKKHALRQELQFHPVLRC